MCTRRLQEGSPARGDEGSVACFATPVPRCTLQASRLTCLHAYQVDLPARCGLQPLRRRRWEPRRRRLAPRVIVGLFFFVERPSSCVDTGWRRNQCRRIDTGTDKRRGFTGVELNAGCDKCWSRGRQRSDARGSRRRCTGAGRWASLLASLGRRRRLALQNTRAHRGRYCSIDLLGCGLDHAQRGRRRRCDTDPCPRWVAMRVLRV